MKIHGPVAGGAKGGRGGGDFAGTLHQPFKKWVSRFSLIE